MNSNFWSKLAISKCQLKEGIINKEAPLILTLEDDMKVLTGESYNVADMKFVLNHSMGSLLL